MSQLLSPGPFNKPTGECVYSKIANKKCVIKQWLKR